MLQSPPWKVLMQISGQEPCRLDIALEEVADIYEWNWLFPLVLQSHDRSLLINLCQEQASRIAEEDLPSSSVFKFSRFFTCLVYLTVPWERICKELMMAKKVGDRTREASASFLTIVPFSLRRLRLSHFMTGICSAKGGSCYGHAGGDRYWCGMAWDGMGI